MTMHTPHSDLPLETVLASLKARSERSFEEGQPYPPEAAHSTAFLQHERERIFMQEWVCVGRADEIPDHGDYLTHDIAGVPVIIIRQEDGSITAFVNACAHRYSRLLNKECGSTGKKIVCPYHAWTYDCSGKLVRAPYMDMDKDFDTSQHRLRPLHTETWEGFIYATLSETPETYLADALKPLTDGVVGRYDMACYQTLIRETMIWNANWKNLIENFTESYHVPVAHGQTFAQHLKPLEDYICGEDSDHYCYHRAPQSSDTGPGAAHPANDRLEGEWRRMMIDFCIFPCHLVTLMPDYLWYISVQPQGTGQMRATWGVAFPPEILGDIPENKQESWLTEFRHYMDIANGEDKPLVESLYRGTASPLLPRGTLHPIERNLWQFTRYLARKCRDAL